jgi:hypothetical protein
MRSTSSKVGQALPPANPIRATVRERILRWLLLLSILLPAAHAQFTLYSVSGSTETLVNTSFYDFGTVPVGATVSVQFQIKNTASVAATLSLLQVAGPGFTLSGGPSLFPQTLSPGGTVNFTVSFESSTTGYADAQLSADGISVVLTASVVAGLSYQVQTATGTQNLGTAGVAFGSVQVGQSQSLEFLINNGTSQALPVPTISVSLGDFSLSGPSPSGATLQPGNQASFAVQFQPSAAGLRIGTLTIGSQTFSLTGTGLAQPPPASQPNLTATFPGLASSLESGQQGSVTVGFASPATAAGSGTLSLAFQPLPTGASDPAIAFSSGGQSIPFTFTAGDIQATFGSQQSASFQTGTTAGTITFTAQIGSASSQQAVVIAPAAVSLTTVNAIISSSASVQVEITGFDNTRTAGPLTFTFYDVNGNVLQPGTISASAASQFAQYFEESSGGSFTLTATFPVVGATSTISFVQATVGNSVGTATTARTGFE